MAHNAPMLNIPFHPAVTAWFERTFIAPTAAQAQAWPAIQSGQHVLIAAPTGSGKTLAAFLAAIDALIQRGMQMPLPDETVLVYVSPLKALSNDIRINLEAPLAGIREELQRLGLPDVDIRSLVRTGDTPASERTLMRKRPPHILVTTPESLYILLGSESGRRMLATTRSVIVDEIHALAPNKRGSHLALSLERLEALCERHLVRIGLSATQKPIAEVARFLVGKGGLLPDGKADCEIIDTGHVRQRDLAIEVPAAPLEAVMSGDVWQQIYDRLADLIASHRTTLIFVNTRRMAERVSRYLSERLGKHIVTAHHGSMAKDQRLDAEQRLKRGELRALVATASLELGIDIGAVDLVCQLGSPRSIAAFLQRVGRSGHAVGGTPKGRLFPQSRDDLVECSALLDAVRLGELDTLTLLRKPMDVLAQQIVAEVASRDWNEAALFELMCRAYPFAKLTRTEFTAVVRMLAEGFTTRHGQRAAYIHRDAVNGVLRARQGARLTALTSGGAIPDTADYQVVVEPQAHVVGSVHEDFAVESLAGDIFQLGNTSYRILRVERSVVRVEDAQGAPPSIPFWLGEAPGRSDELSQAVSRLRTQISERLAKGADTALIWLQNEVGITAPAAQQLVDYLGSAKIALGLLPTQTDLVMERFFDESGGTQLIIHSPFGSRINRAWGLALRKRFCRKFNFELQAAATEDAIVLSLSTSHSFPLEDVARYLHSSSVREVLIQALLDAPMFGVRWRWNAATALALPRYAGGKKVPAQLQRMKSEDLLATVFPDQVACAENLVGEREIPQHPLIDQTLHDCLNEAMDIEGLIRLLHALECGEIRFVARDLTAPSPLAAEILSARPYAFLDDAPLEERRTQAVASRRWTDPDNVEDLGRLDADAIATVRAEAWPEARNAEELHDALLGLAFLTLSEAQTNASWSLFLVHLVLQRRITRLQLSNATMGATNATVAKNDINEIPQDIWIAAERLPQFMALFPLVVRQPHIDAPQEFTDSLWTREAALIEIVRARLSGLGPTCSDVLAATLALPLGDIEVALFALESEGYVMRGHFSASGGVVEWCERHLLARIHRYTVKRLRREIEPVEQRDFMRFLFEWQRVAPGSQVNGPDALANILAQLEGFEAPAAAWESEILPARMSGYEISWLDDLCLSGQIVWTRLRHIANPQQRDSRPSGPVRATPIVLLQRRNLPLWNTLAARGASDTAPTLSSRAQAVVEYLTHHGASFFAELMDGTRLLHTELEDALGELVATGRVNSDSYAGLRALLVPSSKRASARLRQKRRRVSLFGIEHAGRWTLVRRPTHATIEMQSRGHAPELLEHIALTLLRRYGVVFWRLLQREAEWLPPWRDLLRVFHRLEARGEIRGGRFVAGLSGEQFALPDAIATLRKLRQQQCDGTLINLSGADPLNLVGTVLAGNKVPTLTGSRVLYRDGVPIATLVAGLFTALEVMDEAAEWAARNQLLRDTRSAIPTLLQT